MSEKSNETLKRFILEYHHTQTYAEMVQDDDGDWVRYSDYRALAAIDAAAEITRLRAQLAKADALAEALTLIANAPSEMTWGEEAEVNETMNKMEAIADAAITEYRAAREKAHD